MERLALGVDLGGTKLEAAVLRLGGDERAEVVLRKRIATPRDEGYAAIVAACAALARTCAREAGLELASLPVGGGMPGGVRRSDGRVKNSNTTCLNGQPFRADLQAELGREIVFDNDANCFASPSSGPRWNWMSFKRCIRPRSKSRLPRVSKRPAIPHMDCLYFQRRALRD